MSDSQKMNEITNGLVSDLPEGWVWCRMDEIAKINPRHPFNVLPENIEASFLPMPNLNEDNWKIKENKARPFGEIKKGYTHFAEGDVLFAKITPCMENGKAAIARNLVNQIGCGTTELHVIRPHGGIPPEFLYHYIHQESFRQEAEAYMTGTAGQLRVPVDFVTSASIPIPPLQEQILIVNRIELLLERTRKAKESLGKIPLIMKRFRQVALKKAFSGELTAEWREKQQDLESAAKLLKRIQEERAYQYLGKTGQKKYKKLKQQNETIDTSELPELPEGWVWTNVGEISKIIHYGYTASSTDEPTGTKMLRITDIQNNIVNWDTVPFCEIEPKEKEKYLLRDGDLVFARTGATVGKSFLIRGIIPDAVFASYLIRIILSKHIEKYFVYDFFQSLTYWLQINEGQIGIGQPNVNSQILSKIILPIPSLPEQQEIVRRIEALFKFAEGTEKNAAEARKRVEIMTQSILARAFRGDLSADFREAVRNWKNLDTEGRGRYVFALPEEEREKVLNVDEFPMEPASTLLKRIGDEKEKNGNIGNSRRRKR